jgi:hypothetical protein
MRFVAVKSREQQRGAITAPRAQPVEQAAHAIGQPDAKHAR